MSKVSITRDMTAVSITVLREAVMDMTKNLWTWLGNRIPLNNYGQLDTTVLSLVSDTMDTTMMVT